jgi:hypothetical protein
MCGLTFAMTTGEHTKIRCKWNLVEQRWRAGRRGLTLLAGQRPRDM